MSSKADNFSQPLTSTQLSKPNQIAEREATDEEILNQERE
jgi:hypothetical protein